MTDPVNPDLLGHLLGALDDDERERIESRLDEDDALRRRWMAWRRRLAPLDAARPEHEPPPGLAERTCRMVAEVATMARASSPRRVMSCDVSFATPSASFGRLDVAALVLLAVTAALLLFPALYGSRFQSRVAACQEGLRRFGSALAAYGHQRGDRLSRLACEGTLTGSGLLAADWAERELSTSPGQVVCPRAWLAAQDAPRTVSHLLDCRPPRNGLASVAGWHRAEESENSIDEWSGMWRDGTPSDLPSEAQAATPLLADAPSADVPDQAFECHDGRGRNFFFADGHIDFVSRAARPVRGVVSEPTSIFATTELR